MNPTSPKLRIMRKVEIYLTESCHFCHLAKEFFKANSVSFTDHNVGLDISRRKEMVEKSGQMGVPVIIVDDKEVIVGFDKQKLANLLGVVA